MTEHIQERVRAARSERKGVRIAGRSTWLDAGRPVNATDTIEVSALSDVVDYVPGDLTITVGAGMSLEKLAAEAADYRLHLPDLAGFLGGLALSWGLVPVYRVQHDSLWGTPKLADAGSTMTRVLAIAATSLAILALVVLGTMRWAAL